MKKLSIKEKAQEWADMYPSCGMADKSFQAGANYVLEQLSMTISVSEDGYLCENLKKLIELLKKK